MSLSDLKCPVFQFFCLLKCYFYRLFSRNIKFFLFFFKIKVITSSLKQSICPYLIFNGVRPQNYNTPMDRRVNLNEFRKFVLKTIGIINDVFILISSWSYNLMHSVSQVVYGAKTQLRTFNGIVEQEYFIHSRINALHSIEMHFRVQSAHDCCCLRPFVWIMKSFHI